MFKPSLIESITCHRCQLQYNVREITCPHCAGLTDAQASELKSVYRGKSVKQNVTLAEKFRMLIYILVIFALIIVMWR